MKNTLIDIGDFFVSSYIPLSVQNWYLQQFSAMKIITFKDSENDMIYIVNPKTYKTSLINEVRRLDDFIDRLLVYKDSLFPKDLHGEVKVTDTIELSEYLEFTDLHNSRILASKIDLNVVLMIEKNQSICFPIAGNSFSIDDKALWEFLISLFNKTAGKPNYPIKTSDLKTKYLNQSVNKMFGTSKTKELKRYLLESSTKNNTKGFWSLRHPTFLIKN